MCYVLCLVYTNKPFLELQYKLYFSCDLIMNFVINNNTSRSRYWSLKKRIWLKH